MERKQVTYSGLVAMGLVAVTLLTLSCNAYYGGQVTQKPYWTAERKRSFTKAILVIGQAIERERCLSAVILTASDTKTCFECHDTIKR